MPWQIGSGLMDNLKLETGKKPADDSDSGPAAGFRKTKNILSHHSHDWNTPSDWLCLTLKLMSGFNG
jgi:hypothetical protein